MGDRSSKLNNTQAPIGATVMPKAAELPDAVEETTKLRLRAPLANHIQEWTYNVTTVRYIATKNRLSQSLEITGGKTLSLAMADAEAEVAKLTPDGLSAIDTGLDHIEGLLAAEGGHGLYDGLYRHAREIHGIAGVFGLSDLGRGAWCLCEIIELSSNGEASSRAALTANLQSLRLLRRGEGLPAAARATVLEGLEKLVAHKKSKVAPAVTDARASASGVGALL